MVQPVNDTHFPYVRIFPQNAKELSQFTIDFYYTLNYRTNNDEPTFVNHVKTNEQNFILFQQKGVLNHKSLYENQNEVKLGEKIRVTIFADENGFAVYKNEKKLHEKSEKLGKIAFDGSLVLGQDQNREEGGFHIQNSMKGFICNFQMWDHKLNPDEFFSKALKGNYFDSPPTYHYKLKNGAEEVCAIGNPWNVVQKKENQSFGPLRIPFK